MPALQVDRTTGLSLFSYLAFFVNHLSQSNWHIYIYVHCAHTYVLIATSRPDDDLFNLHICDCNLLLLQELPNSLQKSTTSWEPSSWRVTDRFRCFPSYFHSTWSVIWFSSYTLKLYFSVGFEIQFKRRLQPHTGDDLSYSCNQGVFCCRSVFSQKMTLAMRFFLGPGSKFSVASLSSHSPVWFISFFSNQPDRNLFHLFNLFY